jgi:chaperonin GroEL (HSP60 family)
LWRVALKADALHCSNAGFHPTLAIAEARRQVWLWFGGCQKKFVPMIETGVADPTLVIKRALELASSGAMMLLTTDAIVLHRKPQENFEP